MIGATWVDLQLMVNPNALAWVNRYLPEWTQIPIEETTPPQSLSEIQAAIAQSGYRAGGRGRLMATQGGAQGWGGASRACS